MRFGIALCLAVQVLLLQACAAPGYFLLASPLASPPASLFTSPQAGLAERASLALPVNAIACIPGTVVVQPQVLVAVQDAINRDQASLPAMRYCAVTAAVIAPGWQLISVAGLNQLAPDGSWSLTDNGVWFGLVLARQDPDGPWTVAVERTPEFTNWLASVPSSLLNDTAKANLVRPRGVPAAPQTLNFRFPWKPGTQMLYGSLGVHSSGFAGWVTGFEAVDFLSDGDVAAGHAPNQLLAAAPGTIGAYCIDNYSVAIRMDYGGAPQLLYLHLVDNARLRTGMSFNTGDELGQLRTGSFNDRCGYGNQGDQWFHAHFAFQPNNGEWQMENWTLKLSDGRWYNGYEVRQPGAWLTAGQAAASTPTPTATASSTPTAMASPKPGASPTASPTAPLTPLPANPPPAPALLNPKANTVEKAGDDVRFSWNGAATGLEYQIEWTGGPYTTTQPLGWFAGTSYDVGPLAPGTYTWRIRARNAAGPGPWSEARQLTVAPPTGHELYLPLLLSTYSPRGHTQ